MPTAKRRITITITGDIERALEIIEKHYPVVQGLPSQAVVLGLSIFASQLERGATPPTSEATVTGTTAEKVTPQSAIKHQPSPISDDDEDDFEGLK